MEGKGREGWEPTREGVKLHSLTGYLNMLRVNFQVLKLMRFDVLCNYPLLLTLIACLTWIINESNESLPKGIYPLF